MDVSQITAQANQQPATQTGSSEPSVISSDFETFLKMLTAQMENQDPLNPLDSQDFATQLATFSGVEQQVKTNDLLSKLAGQMLVSDLADMAGWIGKEARIAAPAAFDGRPVELFLSPPVGSDSSMLIVRNQAGNIVQSAQVPVGSESYLWQGEGADGAPLPSGTYVLSIESFADGALIETHTPEHYSRVDEVRSVNGQAMIVLQDGQYYPSQTVTGLR